MDPMLAKVDKWATWKNALIVLALFVLNTVILDALERPLVELASGEPKLDLRFGYDLETVQMLFRSYGEEGRSLYVWNLLVDSPFPVLGAIATVLFVFLGFDRQSVRTTLAIPPLVFAITDLIENLLIVFMLQRYPSLSRSLVASVSIITQVKRSGYYLTAAILPVSLIVGIIKAVMQRDVVSSDE